MNQAIGGSQGRSSRLTEGFSGLSIGTTTNFCLTVRQKLYRFAPWRRADPWSPSRIEVENAGGPLRAGVDRRRVHRACPCPVGASRRRRPGGSRGLLARAQRRGRAANSAPSATFAAAEELISSDEVDVVHVCAPNDLHLPLARRRARAGKHVVCEKPVALDAAGAAELVARRRGVRAGRHRAVRLPVLPDRAGGPRAGPRGADRRRAAGPRHLPAGLAPRRR